MVNMSISQVVAPSGDASIGLETHSIGALSSTLFSMPEALCEGEIYRLRADYSSGYLHRPAYEEGRHIHLRILTDLGDGSYRCSSRDHHGNFLADGGGWTPEYEQRYGIFHRSDLEPIAGR